MLLWFWLADRVFISFSLKYRVGLAIDTRPAGTVAAHIQAEKQLAHPTSVPCGLGEAKAYANVTSWWCTMNGCGLDSG